MLKIEFKTANDAFFEEPGEEVASILTGLIERFRDGDTGTGTVYDTNGNNVGTWYFVPGEE